MLKIFPLGSSEEQEKVCLKSGIVYQKNRFCYGAYEDDDIIGGAQFTVSGETGTITDLNIIKEGEEKLALSMLLGRAVLNFLDLHGVKEAFYLPTGEYHEKAAKLIGFRSKDGKQYAYLDGMFTAHHHENENQNQGDK